MKFRFELRCVADDQEEVHPIASLERNGVAPETLGLTPVEGKASLKTIHEVMVEKPLARYVESQRRCPDCGAPRPLRGHHHINLRSAFGNCTVDSPRLGHCACRPHGTKTFSPLAEPLPEHTSPELPFLESKRASLLPHGVTADLLKDVLPVDEKLSDVTIQNHLLQVAERMEQALGDERHVYIEGCPQEWERLPIPDGPLLVGIDGGFVRARGWRKPSGRARSSIRCDSPLPRLERPVFSALFCRRRTLPILCEICRPTTGDTCENSTARDACG
jgi:hypothetical protein